MARRRSAAPTVTLARAAAAFIVAWGACTLAFAQASAPRQDEPPPSLGVQSQNIFQVKPDASTEPNYLKQSNAERNRVQPGNNSPLYRDVQRGVEGTTSYPKDRYPEMGVLIQAPVQYPGTAYLTAGEAWRQVRNNWIVPYGGSLFLIALGALAIYYFARGPLGHHGAGEGARKIERFTPFERSAHWANATAFSILAITGLVMAFGRFFLLPVLGLQLYGPLTYVLKTLHNFAGPVFTVSLVIVFVTFLRDNWPQRGDLRWLLKFGGAFSKSGDEPPSHRFNAGEKIVFWIGVFLLGLFAVSSGWVLDKLVPGIAYDRMIMQYAHMVHSTAAILMLCVFALHIYLGTIGMKGAYTAMRHGWVGEDWAREHHAYWAEDVAAGRIPAVRSEPRGFPRDGETVEPA
jgi:formate dehydrogenase subunit gamma